MNSFSIKYAINNPFYTFDSKKLGNAQYRQVVIKLNPHDQTNENKIMTHPN